MSDKVPEDWEKSSIDELLTPNCLFSDGDWVESKDQDPNGTNRLIQLADIGDGKFLNKSNRFMNDEQFERLNCTELKQGDILIARMPDPIGRASIFPKTLHRSATVVDVAVLRPTAIDNYWLMSVINSSEFRKEIEENATGTTRTRIGKTALSKITIPTPPLQEQKKIASILTSMDEVIEKTQSQIDKLQDLKKGTRNELLTKGIGHSEFKESALGRIPKSWEVRHLSDIAIIKGGKRLPKGFGFSDSKTEYPYIRVTDFKEGTIDLSNLKYVSNEVRESIQRYIISDKDIYISIAGSIGIVGTIPNVLNGALLTENAAKIVINDSNIDKKFLKDFLCSDKGQKQFSVETGTGGGVPKLALFRISETVIPIPPLQEQKQIVGSLHSVEQRIQILNKKLHQTQSLKKSLMQDLLTGKVRVQLN